MTENEKKKKMEEMAMFKYSLIAPVVTGTYIAPSAAAYFKEVSKKSFVAPNKEIMTISASTLERWYYAYQKNGLNALRPKTRSDYGTPRVLSQDVINRIMSIKDEFPHITGKAIYDKLVKEGTISAKEMSLATVHRFLKSHNLKPVTNLKEVRRFEKEKANHMWQADSSTGVYLIIGKEKFKTYLVLILDDKSRYVVHAEYFFEDNAINFQTVLRKAITKFGKPSMLMLDNGKPYKNKQLTQICANIGVKLAYNLPNSPASKGKVERIFRTIKNKFSDTFNWNTIESLEELNELLWNFLHHEYNNAPHSGINGKTPMESFLEDFDDKVKNAGLSEERVNIGFMHRRESKVSNAATIRINNCDYEVPQKYIRQTITVSYHPDNMNELYIYDDNNKLLHTVYPVNKIENSKVKRQLIDFTKGGF